MKWICIFVIFVILLIYVGFSHLENNRLETCKVVIERGHKHEATEFEYYDCLGG